jgi:hypothetical protein
LAEFVKSETGVCIQPQRFGQIPSEICRMHVYALTETIVKKQEARHTLDAWPTAYESPPGARDDRYFRPTANRSI